jgi:hypothetical protein
VELLPSSLRGWVGEGTAAEGASSLCGQEVPLPATAHRVLALVIREQYGANSNSAGIHICAMCPEAQPVPQQSPELA